MGSGWLGADLSGHSPRRWRWTLLLAACAYIPIFACLEAQPVSLHNGTTTPTERQTVSTVCVVETTQYTMQKHTQAEGGVACNSGATAPGDAWDGMTFWKSPFQPFSKLHSGTPRCDHHQLEFDPMTELPRKITHGLVLCTHRAPFRVHPLLSSTPPRDSMRGFLNGQLREQLDSGQLGHLQSS